MIFEHRGKQYAYEQGTGEIGEMTPGEELNDTNPTLVCKPTVTNQPAQQLVLEVSQQCNLRCQYCKHTHQGIPGVRPHRDVQMTPKIAQAALDLFFANCTDDAPICFYGGEPLLQLDLIKDIVERYPERSYMIDTNGQLVDEGLARWAAQYNIGWQISLDGPPEINDRYRGGGSALKATEGACMIRAFSNDEANIRLASVFIPTLENLEDGAWFDDHFPDMDLSVNIANLRGSSINRSSDEITTMNAVLSKARELYRDQVVEGNRDHLSTFHRRLFEPGLVSLKSRHEGEVQTWIPGGFCDPGVRRIYVTATGEILPCEKVSDEYRMGNVFDGIDWQKVTDMHNKFHVEYLGKGCASCWAVRLCSGCWAVEVSDCDGKREQILDDIKLYIDLCETGQAGWMKDTELV